MKMKNFSYTHPTEIQFGYGKFNELGKIATRFGKKCLLVTVKPFPEMEPIFKKAKALLEAEGIQVAHFDGVEPNPTTEVISKGAKLAREHKSEMVIGLGGGSSMDSAKAIAVEATHEGSCWDYLFFKTPPTVKTLPIIAVTTTSGTGSEVTQVAVVTKTDEHCKSALYNSILFPRVAIVDPELSMTIPPQGTSPTGFDAFTHAFEAYLHPNASPYTDILAIEAMRLVVHDLPIAIKDGKNIEARSAMAWASTLGGLSIANAGVTLPHGMGMAISGIWPNIAHGQSLAIVYPSFTRFTYESAIDRFATMARIFDPSLNAVDNKTAAQKSCELIDNFLKDINLWIGLKDFGATEDQLSELATASMVLPDYKSNPRVATKEEMFKIAKECYQR
jgi:alcohol dehydrogenase class IV